MKPWGMDFLIHRLKAVAVHGKPKPNFNFEFQTTCIKFSCGFITKSNLDSFSQAQANTEGQIMRWNLDVTKACPV